MTSRHVDVGVGPLERAVPPCLHRLEGLLVEVGDGRGGHARAPQDLAHVLDAPRRDAREVHLDHRLLDAGLPPAVALDDRRGEAHALELGHPDRHLAGRRRELPLVASGAVGLAVGGAPVALGAHEVSGLLLEEAVQRVLDGPPDELAEIGPQGFLVQRYNGIGHGLPPACFLSRQLESYRGGPCPPLCLDAIPLSKCARNCTLPSEIAESRPPVRPKSKGKLTYGEPVILAMSTEVVTS